MRTLLATVSLCAVLVVGCTPPCDPITPAAQAICHRADGGAIAVNAPFTLHATTNVSGTPTCTVSVDGGSIVLGFGLSDPGCGSGNAAAPRAAPQPVPCAIPALPAGTYSLNTTPPTTLAVPPADGGVTACL